MPCSDSVYARGSAGQGGRWLRIVQVRQGRVATRRAGSVCAENAGAVQDQMQPLLCVGKPVGQDFNEPAPHPGECKLEIMVPEVNDHGPLGFSQEILEGLENRLEGGVERRRLHELAAKFVVTGPDVIVTGFGTETAKAVQAATTAIPIIFASVGDPIGAGIVKSLSRPDKNITGLTSMAAEISGKRLQILEELATGIRVIAVIVSPGYPFTAVALPQLRTAANAPGLRLEVCEVQTADELPTKVEAAIKSGATGLISRYWKLPPCLVFVGKLLISPRSSGSSRSTRVAILLM